MNKINVIDVGAAGPGLSIPGYELNVLRFEPREGTPALYSREGDFDLFITRDPMASSLRMPGPGIHDYWNQAMFDIVGTKQVECQRLDTFWTTEEIHLLKIDTQGTEWEVLQGAAKTLAKVDVILCEVEFVELYTGQFLFDSIVSLLLFHNFRFVDFTDGERVRGKRIWADALFVRNDAPPIAEDIVIALTHRPLLRRINALLRSEGLWHWDNMLRRPFRRTPQ